MERQRIFQATDIFFQNSQLDTTSLIKEFCKQGFSQLESNQIVVFMPRAFAQPILENMGVTVLPTVSVMTRNGGWTQTTFAEIAIYEHMLALARQHMASGILNAQTYEAILSHSAEYNTVNTAFQDGADIEGSRVAIALIAPPYADDLGIPNASFFTRIKRFLQTDIARSR